MTAHHAPSDSLAARAERALRMAPEVVVALAVVHAPSRSVLHGAATLPNARLAPGDNPLRLAGEIRDGLAVDRAAEPTLVDVLTGPRGTTCELRYAVVVTEEPDAAAGLSWLSVDSSAPFHTTDWAVLRTALADLLHAA